MEDSSFKINNLWIRMIACISMLFDHIGVVFFSGKMLFRIIGRIAFPLFAYQVAQGVNKTKNKGLYTTRLFVLAFLSQPLYLWLFKSNKLNVIFLFALFALTNSIISFFKPVMPNKKLVLYMSLCLKVILHIVVHEMSIEYGVIGLLTLEIFELYTENVISFRNTCLLYILLIIVQGFMSQNLLTGLICLFATCSILIIRFDTGKFVKLKGIGRWIIFLFYPIHLMLLLVLSGLS